MHRATSSSSSAASSSSSRSRQRISREQLERSLKVLGRPSDPLPIELPPSPPASRDSSPAPSFKRKSEYSAEPGPSKRPRTNSMSEGHHQGPSSSSHRAARHSHLRTDPPSEDGELREDLSAPRDVVILANVPVRRPRRGPVGKIPPLYFARLHDKFYSSARALKFSGEARSHANCRPSSSMYRPLSNPPPTSSSYHKNGNTIARLETLEALIHFAYSFWAKDIERGRMNRAPWRNMHSFYQYCKGKWVQDAVDDREKALLGVIYMLDGFINGFRIRDQAREINIDNDRVLKLLEARNHEKRERVEREKASLANGPNGAGSLATPPMLPSPASMTSSASSTPAGKRADEAVPPAPVAKEAQNRERDPQPDKSVTIEMNWFQIKARRSLTDALVTAWDDMKKSQDLLSLPILAKHYPRTFARVIHTTLSANDEHEPDIEDEEGELYWPGQLLAGGVGWVCALGKAMIKEFGKEFGYRGIDSVVRKDEGDPAFPQEVPDPAAEPNAP